MSRARPKPIIPWWQLGLLLFACAVGIWFLLPDDPGLLEDLIRDGNTKDARRVLAKMSPAAREREAHRLRVIELRLARLELKGGDRAAFDRFWSQAIGTWRTSQFSTEVFLEFIPVVSRLPDPAAAWRQILPTMTDAPEVQRQRLASDFTRAALAANQPADAARIFAAVHPPGQRTPAQSLELARLWQLGGDATAALTALGEDTEPAILTRRIELLRALNRNREALALLRQHVATTAGGIPNDALAGELATVALAAGLPGDAAMLLRSHAEQHPQDIAAQRRLRDLLVASGHSAEALAPALRAVQASSRAPADLRALAQIMEYAGRGAEAFDPWLELALQGDLPAVDRLVALNPGVYRDEDLRRALEKVVPVPGHTDYTLKLARIEVGVGRYAEGQRYYEQYLAAMPQDVGAVMELADLHRELYRFPEAARWLHRAVELSPHDISLHRQVADNLVLQNRHADALDYYAKLAPEAPVEDVLQPYIVLAEALGRYDHLIRALRLRIDHAAKPAARDYLLIAYAYELIDDPEGRAAVLAEGRHRLAQDDDLKLQFALAQSAAKNYRAAQADLASHTGLHANPAAATLYLELMRLNNDQAAERAYLAQPLDPALLQDEAIGERIGRAHEALGNYAEAERIWRRLYEIRPTDFDRAASLARVLMTTGRTAEAGRLLAPFLRQPTPAVLRLSAEIASIAGDYRNAEAYQLAFLERNRDAGPTDWGALGDIRLSRGDREGAKRAYAEALRRQLLHLGTTARAADEFMSDTEVLQRAATLMIEERRYLIYLYARLNQASVAEALARQLLKDNPSDRQTLLALASMAGEHKDGESMLHLARDFLSFYPGDYQGRYFLAAGHYLARHYAEANQVLRELKREQFGGRKFPYETDLAASAYAAGVWYRAMLSYQELLRHHDLGDDLRNRVRIALDGLYREHLPRWDLGVYGTRLEHAEVWRYTGAGAQHLGDRHWLAINYTRDHIDIAPSPGLRDTTAQRTEAVAHLTTTRDRRWETQVSLGASGEGLVGGAGARYRFADQRVVSLDYSANERALDSLALEALDGRQDRASVTASWLIEADLVLMVRSQWREVRIAGRKLGRGSGLELNLDHTFRRQGPRLSLGYRGSLGSFDRTLTDPAPVAALADPLGGFGAQLGVLDHLVSQQINRHGLGFLATDNLADAWLYRFSAGMDYDFELSSIGWNGALAITFQPRKSIELTAEAGYTSSAASSNAGSSASLLNFYVRIYH